MIFGEGIDWIIGKPPAYAPNQGAHLKQQAFCRISTVNNAGHDKARLF